MAGLKECPNNHLFNATKHGDTCPVCGSDCKEGNLADKSQEELEKQLRLPEQAYVCAWLVCTQGLNCGRSYPIHRGKNFIGSADGMDVQILGDSFVDSYRHGCIVFDDKNGVALALPGESKSLVYLDKKAVYAPAQLEPFSQLTVGSSQLYYVPFCGANFEWNKS